MSRLTEGGVPWQAPNEKFSETSDSTCLWKESEDKLQYVIALSHSLRTPLTLHKHTFNINDTKCKKRTCVVPINLSALSTTYLLCQTQFQEVNHGIKIISTIHKIFKIFRVTPQNIFQPSYQTWDLTRFNDIETFSWLPVQPLEGSSFYYNCMGIEQTAFQKYPTMELSMGLFMY